MSSSTSQNTNQENSQQTDSGNSRIEVSDKVTGTIEAEGAVNGLFGEDESLQPAAEVVNDSNCKFRLTEKQRTEEQVNHDPANGQSVDQDHLQ